MAFFLLLLQFAPFTARNYIIEFLPQAVHLPLLLFTGAFYVIITYHLMGYVILQYHERIGYDVDWRKVHELMKKAALQTSGILSDPEPFVLEFYLGDFAVTYLVIGKTNEPKRAY